MSVSYYLRGAVRADRFSDTDILLNALVKSDQYRIICSIIVFLFRSDAVRGDLCQPTPVSLRQLAYTILVSLSVYISQRDTGGFL